MTNKILLVLLFTGCNAPISKSCAEFKRSTIDCLIRMESVGTEEYNKYKILLENREHNTIEISTMAIDGIVNKCVLTSYEDQHND